MCLNIIQIYIQAHRKSALPKLSVLHSTIESSWFTFKTDDLILFGVIHASNKRKYRLKGNEEVSFSGITSDQQSGTPQVLLQ